MYLEREFVAAHQHMLEELLARSHRIAFWMFLLTFAGYGLAFWLWYTGQPWTGLLIASLGYLFFRQFRTLSLGLARTALRGDAAAAPVLRGLEQALEQGKPGAVMAELEAHLAALRGSAENSRS